LKTELLNRINGGGPRDYSGLVKLVLGDNDPPIPVVGVLTHVNNFFAQGEQAINNTFNGLAAKLGGTPPVALKGAGSTAHSTFTATPNGGGSSSSNVTQSTWALNKFNAGIGAGGGAQATLTSGLRTLGDDPISDFFNTFVARLAGDGDLSSQWAQVKAGAQGLGNAGSAGDFIKQGLAELLRILALVLDGALAVTNAFVDGLLANILDLVTTMFDPNSGILTTEIPIPVLSWLYQQLFGEPLTFLNAIMLIIAIPVTILWRIVEGQWPLDSVGAVATSSRGLTTLPPILNRLIAYANAIATAGVGFIFAAGDVEGDGDVPLLIGRAALACSVLTSIFSIPSFTKDSPTDLAWAAWGLGLGTGLLNILGSVSFDPAAGERATILGSLLLAILSFFLAVTLGQEFKDTPGPDIIDDAEFGLEVAALLPGFLNPAKLISVILAAGVAILDVVMGFAGATEILINTFAS